jgi:hypothetical protein
MNNPALFGGLDCALNAMVRLAHPKKGQEKTSAVYAA